MSALISTAFTGPVPVLGSPRASVDNIEINMPAPKEVLTGQRKRDDIVRILNSLEEDLKRICLLPPVRNQLLDDLKIHTRSTDDAEALFCQRGVSILCQHAFHTASPTTSRVALRCLGNVMFFQAPRRQEFVDLGFAPQAADRMKSDNREDELLSARLLFLCTYDTRLDFKELFAQNNLAETINSNLARHAKHFAKTSGKSDLPQPDILAVNETLKLLYNLTNYYPEQRSALTKSLLSILKILANIRLPKPPLQQPVNALVNAMIHLDLEDSKARIFPNNPLFPLFNKVYNIDRLCSILLTSLSSYTEQELDALASPLVQVLLRISEFAPPAPKNHMRTLLLPSDEERDKALGKSDTLPGYLLRLSSSPMAPHMRQFIPALMFELSGKDAKEFVKNVGYGFAAGFLLTHGMEVPENALQAWSTGNTQESESRIEEVDDENETDDVDSVVRQTGIPVSTRSSISGANTGANASSTGNAPGKSRERFEVNPITGQRLDKEPEIKMPEMTEDEKLKEAERLFVLFERLKATGVVNVENPVAQAVREGRFEELD